MFSKRKKEVIKPFLSFEGWVEVPPINSKRPAPPPCQHGNSTEKYRVFTKDDYKRYRLSILKDYDITKGTISHIDEVWQDISKGFNFIIGVGQEGNLMFYGAEYFSNNVLK